MNINQMAGILYLGVLVVLWVHLHGIYGRKNTKTYLLNYIVILIKKQSKVNFIYEYVYILYVSSNIYIFIEY